MSSMSVLPVLLSICVYSSLLTYIRLSLFWLVLSIGPDHLVFQPTSEQAKYSASDIEGLLQVSFEVKN